MRMELLDVLSLRKKFKVAEGRRSQNTPTSDAMLSDPARLWEGLVTYGHMEVDTTNDWSQTYLYIYYRRLRGKLKTDIDLEGH